MLSVATYAGLASAVPVFNETSFENGASTAMVQGTGYSAGVADANQQLSTLTAGVWNVNVLNSSFQTLALRDKSDLNPAGVTGNQYSWGSIGNGGNNDTAGWHDRTFFQVVLDNKATTGSIQATIDYWGHKIGTGGDGQGDILLQIFAFDDPSQVFVDTGNAAGNLYVNDGAGGSTSFITSGQSTFETVNVVDASTGFQALSEVSLDLGTGYNYIGIAVTNQGFGNTTITNADTVAFDNLVVVPEPSSLALLGLGGLLIARRRPVPIVLAYLKSISARGPRRRARWLDGSNGVPRP